MLVLLLLHFSLGTVSGHTFRTNGFYFLREEYYKSNAEVAYSWSIKLRNASVDDKEVDDTELMEIEETVEETEVTAIKKELTKVPKSSQPSARAMLK
jgi:hypothetical protein